jgi:signal transduction histidine kinase
MRTDFADKHRKAMADRVQLQRVLMNLMLNAVEAMADNDGELSMRSQLREDGQAVIPVSDTAVRLPTGNVEQIFDAFFSTKSQCTGLGLAITRSIIESHGRRIWAAANSGAGATFHLALPVREAATT